MHFGGFHYRGGFMGVKGKNILITGSSRGIGKVLATRLAAQGANVCIHYQFSEKNAFKLADQLHQDYGVDVMAIAADMNSKESIEQLFKSIASRWSRLDGLVLNAASGNRKPLLNQEKEDWNRITGINVLGPIHCVRYGLPLFNSQGARVLMLSSEGARFGIPHYGAIGVSKAALESVVRQLSVELKTRPISINGLSATLVRTAALDAVTHGKMDIFQEKYFIEPEDLAKMATYLLSDDCPATLKGQIIRLDNGTLSEFSPTRVEGHEEDLPDVTL